MIIRIMTEGQWRVDDAAVEELNQLDAAVESAVETGDEATFESALGELLAAVRRLGSAVPADELVDSDLVLPPPDATVDEVRLLLTDEGLIPG